MSIKPRAVSDFESALYQFIRTSEGAGYKVYPDQKGIPTVGTGYALLQKINGSWRLTNSVIENLQSVGIIVQQSDRDKLQEIADALNAGNTAQARSITKSGNFSFTVDDVQARQLFDYVVPQYEAIVRQKIGEDLYAQLQDSKEMIGLISLAYNSPKLIGPCLVEALREGNKAEAWYQIRYESNREKSLGLANRRYRESDMFGLFDGDSPTLEESKEIITMYETHKDKILFYENRFKKNRPPIGEMIAVAENVVKNGDPSWFPAFVKDVARWLDPVFAANKLLDIWKGVLNAAAAVVRRDPLILDLDGDGLETTGVKDGAYFDHDGNGFAEQTGWAYGASHNRRMYLFKYTNDSVQLLDVIGQAYINLYSMDFTTIYYGKLKHGYSENGYPQMRTDIKDIDGNGKPEVRIKIYTEDKSPPAFELYLEIVNDRLQVNLNPKLYKPHFENVKRKYKRKIKPVSYYVYGFLMKQIGIGRIKTELAGDKDRCYVVELLENVDKWNSAFHDRGNEKFELLQYNLNGG